MPSAPIENGPRRAQGTGGLSRSQWLQGDGARSWERSPSAVPRHRSSVQCAGGCYRAGEKALKTESKRVSGLRLRLAATYAGFPKSRRHADAAAPSDQHLSLELRLSCCFLSAGRFLGGTASSEYPAQVRQLQPAPPQSTMQALSSLHTSFVEARHDRTPTESRHRAARMAECDRLH